MWQRCWGWGSYRRAEHLLDSRTQPVKINQSVWNEGRWRPVTFLIQGLSYVLSLINEKMFQVWKVKFTVYQNYLKMSHWNVLKYIEMYWNVLKCTKMYWNVSKCKLSSLRSQCCKMRDFLECFSYTVTSIFSRVGYLFCHYYRIPRRMNGMEAFGKYFPTFFEDNFCAFGTQKSESECESFQ